MMDLTFMNQYSPVFVLVITWILSFAALKILKVPSPDWATVVISALFAVMFASSAKASAFIIKIIPYFAIILVVTLLVFLVVALTGNVGMFQKPMAWIGFIVALAIVIFFLFSQFHSLSHMLPGTSDSGLTNEMEDFKDWLYSDNVKDSLVFLVSIGLVGFFLLKKS